MSDTQRDKSSQLELFDTFQVGIKAKDSINLARWPTSVLAQAAPDQTTLHFKDSYINKNGLEITQEVIVSGTDTWGLPTYKEDEILLALLQICRRLGYPKKFRFTRYQLIKELGWNKSGVRYEDIYTGLHRLATTSYTYQKSWYGMQEKSYKPSVTLEFIQSLVVVRPEDLAEIDENKPYCEITFADEFQESLQEGALKQINYGFWKTIKSPVAKRIYRYLDLKCFSGKNPKYSEELNTFAIDKIGINKKYRNDTNRIKTALSRAIKELEDKRYLEPMPNDLRYKKIASKVYHINFRLFKDRAKQLSENESEENSAASQLKEYGVTAEAVAKIIAQTDDERIQKSIGLLEHQIAKGNEVKNPAGFLVKACTSESEFSTPTDYKSAEEIELIKREEERKQLQREAKQKAIDEAKQKAEQEEERKFNEVVKYLDSLSEDQIGAMEEKLKQNNPLARTASKKLLRALLIAKLQEGEMKSE